MKSSIRISSVILCCLLLLPLLLGLFSCSGEAPTENRVASVVLEEDGIRIEATLTPAFLDGYSQKKVYLFELPSAYTADADLSELDPVAEVKAREKMTVTLPLYDGARSRLYSSYLVASFDPATNTYAPLTPAAALSNPQALAPETPAPMGKASIKGLIATNAADAIRMGVAHTVVDVPMESLILSGWQEGAVSYVYDGVTRYLDAEALAALDESVGVYIAAGVEVYLRFLLGDPTDRNVPLGLYLQGAPSTKAEGYAVNMTTTFSASIVEGFLSFVANRYATPDEEGRAVTAFILGQRANDPACNIAVGMEQAAYIANYEKLTRVAYTALVSHNPNGRVYVAVDGLRAVTEGEGMDTAAFLTAFAEEVARRGDYGWHVACELYADAPVIWEADYEEDSAYFTVRNLDALTGLLDSPALVSEGESRRLLISGFSIPAVVQGEESDPDNDNEQAASYAYAYLTCVKNGRVEALIYDTHVDPAHTSLANSLCGIWTAAPDLTISGSGLDLTLRPATPRPLYNVFTLIDTTEAATLTNAMTTVIGASYATLADTASASATAVQIVRGSATLLPYDDNHRGATLFDFNNGSDNGFTDGGGLTYMELVAAETLGKNTLHARFDRDSLNSPMGLTVTVPASSLIGGKELVLDLHAGLMGNTASAKSTVPLRLTRAAKGAVAEGLGEIRYEASVSEIKSASWQTVSFDISSFTTLLDASDEVTLTLTMDYPLDTAPNGPTAHHMGLAGIYVTGATAGSSLGIWITIAIAAVLVVATVVITALIVTRRRRRLQEASETPDEAAPVEDTPDDTQ